VKIYSYMICLAVLLSFVSHATGEVDPATVLPGTWDGWFETGAPAVNPARTLIIESVTAKEGGAWTAKSKFGESGAKLNDYNIEVSVMVMIFT